MYRSTRNHLMFLTLGSLLVGCASESPQPTAVVVQPPATVQHERVVVHEPVTVPEAPPSPRSEITTAAPSSQHVWVPGYWSRRYDDWVWRSGHWELRPYPDAQWVPGRWVATSDGWRWSDGHWE